MDKYYQKVSNYDFDKIKTEFQEIFNNGTTELFVNMVMLCIKEEESSSIEEIIFTSKEIDKIRSILIEWQKKNKKPNTFKFRYNQIKDVNDGRIEAGLSTHLVNLTKNLIKHKNYIQWIQEECLPTTIKKSFRGLVPPNLESCNLLSNDIKFTLLKMPDEWYWIAFYSITPETYWKCDGFIGLEKLLRNIMNI